MTCKENSFLDDSILYSVDGDSLLGLATAIEDRLDLLVRAKNRERVRKDERLKNIGIHFNVGNVLERNYRTIVFLSYQALKYGSSSKDAYQLLVRSLYKLNHLESALYFSNEAYCNNFFSPELEKLQRLIYIELGDKKSLAEYAKSKKSPPSEFRTYKVIDYPDFDQWYSLANAVAIEVSKITAVQEKLVRCCIDDKVVEITNGIRSDELVGAHLYDLEILGGSIPCAYEAAYYDLGFLHNCTKDIPSCETSNTRIIRSTSNDQVKYLRGKYIVSSGSMSYYNNYFHSICQIYSRIALALQNPLFDNFKILLPEGLPAWATTFFSKCGIVKERIKFVPKKSIVKIEEAVVLPMKWDICPNEISAIRDALGVPKARNSEKGQKYYMLRKKVKNHTRALVNEDDFIEICRSRGFQIIDPLEYPIEGQIELFQNARLIVTSSSSAETNMLYSISGAEIISIVPKLFWGMLSADCATCCGHNMSFIFGDYISDQKFISHPHNPYVANPAMLTKLLDEVIPN